MPTSNHFAVVTGASTGIGLELARCCVREGYPRNASRKRSQPTATKFLRSQLPRSRQHHLARFLSLLAGWSVPLWASRAVVLACKKAR
jgi:NAD(P)-dependent dehydrogenase (short-subunit alcohol dehydrogenase family)